MEKQIVNNICKCVCMLSHSVMSDSATPIDSSPPGSSAHGIFHATIVEWVSISYSRGSSQTRDQICISCIGSQIFYC